MLLQPSRVRSGGRARWHAVQCAAAV
ncbi:YkgJ family cysteine cluster protein, partial [Xanthomonas oryzae pv. oryzae]